MAANPNLSERLAIEPAAKEEFYEEYRRLSPIGYANSLRALLAMDHITDQLPRLRVPVLLIGGDRDPSLAPMKVMHRKFVARSWWCSRRRATSATAISPRPGTGPCSSSWPGATSGQGGSRRWIAHEFSSSTMIRTSESSCAMR